MTSNISLARSAVGADTQLVLNGLATYFHELYIFTHTGLSAALLRLNFSDESSSLINHNQANDRHFHGRGVPPRLPPASKRFKMAKQELLPCVCCCGRRLLRTCHVPPVHERFGAGFLPSLLAGPVCSGPIFVPPRFCLARSWWVWLLPRIPLFSFFIFLLLLPSG